MLALLWSMWSPWRNAAPLRRSLQDPGLWAKVPQRVLDPLPSALAEGSRGSLGIWSRGGGDSPGGFIPHPYLRASPGRKPSAPGEAVAQRAPRSPQSSAQALCLPGPRPGSLIPVNLPRMPLGCGSALPDGALGRSSSFQSSTLGRETTCVDLGNVSLRWCYSRSNWSAAGEAGFAGGRG